MRSSPTSDIKQEMHEPDLSLEEMFVRDAERLELTPEKVRSDIDARHSLVRKKLLADYGLTEETLDTASEDTKSELASKLMYEIAHSPDAKLEYGFLKAAVAREKRSLVKAKAEEILAVQRKRALNLSIPNKLLAAVRQRSEHLYYSELIDHFRSKYIEEIEKSDAYIPEVKAIMLENARNAVDMPSMMEVGRKMSAELLHPDALGQIVAEHQSMERAQRERRRKKIQQFFHSDYWFGVLPLFVRKLVAPPDAKLVLSALSEEIRHLKDNAGPFGPSLGADIITSKIVDDILRWAKEIKGDVHNGKPPRAIALYLMANVTRDYLASGRFHIYRGRLSMQGNSLRAIAAYCYSELVKIGQMTSEEAVAAQKATNTDIQEVG